MKVLDSLASALSLFSGVEFTGRIKNSRGVVSDVSRVKL